jgi:hypothetical protein
MLQLISYAVLRHSTYMLKTMGVFITALSNSILQYKEYVNFQRLENIPSLIFAPY